MIVLYAWLAALACFAIILMMDYIRKLNRKINSLQQELELHEEALIWAVGTGKLPSPCPGHFMHLLIAAKHECEWRNR